MGWAYTASKEGREARKEGRPRKSPYENIPALRHWNAPWLDGWDAMDSAMSRKVRA